MVEIPEALVAFRRSLGLRMSKVYLTMFRARHVQYDTAICVTWCVLLGGAMLLNRRTRFCCCCLHDVQLAQSILPWGGQRLVCPAWKTCMSPGMLDGRNALTNTLVKFRRLPRTAHSFLGIRLGAQ